MSEQVLSSDIDSICRICFEAGEVAVTEQLPYGQAMQCTHENREIHTWTRYNSLASLGQRKTGKPLAITCPKCGMKGTVNYYRPNLDRTDQVTYVVRHEKIKGTWGKDRIRRVRRCYVADKEGKAKIRDVLDKRRK